MLSKKDRCFSENRGFVELIVRRRRRRIAFGLFLLDMKNLFEIDDQLTEQISATFLVFISELSLQNEKDRFNREKTVFYLFAGERFESSLEEMNGKMNEVERQTNELRS